MADRDIIDESYCDLLKQLFFTFFQSYTSAQGDHTAEQEAGRIFSKGVAHARFIRDRATSLLP